MNLYVISISWFGLGFLTALLLVLTDMRNKEYDADYFKDNDNSFTFFITVLFGYISFVLCLMYFIFQFKLFTKFCYWLANIGTKKKINLDKK